MNINTLINETYKNNPLIRNILITASAALSKDPAQRLFLRSFRDGMVQQGLHLLFDRD